MSMRSEADELLEQKEKERKLRDIGDKLDRLDPEDREAIAEVLRSVDVDVTKALELSRNYKW